LQGILACKLLFFYFFTRLPEKQVRTDSSTENRHQNGPFITGVRRAARRSADAGNAEPLTPATTAF
jgi:hypothetical protein